MSNVTNTISISPQSTPIRLINESLELSALKTGPRLLLARLVSWSGKKGRCWHSVETMADRLSVSVRTLQRWKRELIETGFLAEIASPYRTPYLIPYPEGLQEPVVAPDTLGVTDVSPPFLKEKRIKKRCTVDSESTCTQEAPPPSPEPNVNAVEVLSPDKSPTVTTASSVDIAQEPIPAVQIPSRSEPISHHSIPSTTTHNPEPRAPFTQDHLIIVEEIERVTGDTWSRGHFVNLVRQVDEQTVYAALSVTREKMALESGVNGGAYFTATLKGMMGLAGLGERDSHSSTPYSLQPPRVPTPPEARPMSRSSRIEESDPVDPESLKKGWRLHYRGGGFRGMLTLVQRCVPLSVDVGRLWDDIRETFSGIEESILIDRFLDTAVTRMKHAERVIQDTYDKQPQ